MMKLITALLLILLNVSAAVAQSPATGALLVATDELRDSRFSETVILLLHYGPDGESSWPGSDTESEARPT